MGKIRVNYDNARAKARELEQAAAECSKVENHLRNTLNNSYSTWKGDAADQFRVKLNEQILILKHNRSALNSIASEIRTVVNRLEAAEKKIVNNTGR